MGNSQHESCKIGMHSSLPRQYRQYARIYTDHWEAYRSVLPSKRHFAVDKDSGLTSHIERLNNTLRQRISRLVRRSLSFSKKLENHIGAIWNFIHHYNQKIREKLQREQTTDFSHPLPNGTTPTSTSHPAGSWEKDLESPQPPPNTSTSLKAHSGEPCPTRIAWLGSPLPQ
ncbi:IS1 transposase [Leptolyngbya sp. O-77]|nr:IS1 transposase [Leptolyngbya sp. O-77]